MTAIEERRAAVRAQLEPLSEHELRLFVGTLAIKAVELPLAEFLANLAQVGEKSSVGELFDEARAAVNGAGMLVADLAKGEAVDYVKVLDKLGDALVVLDHLECITPPDDGTF